MRTVGGARGVGRGRTVGVGRLPRLVLGAVLLAPLLLGTGRAGAVTGPANDPLFPRQWALPQIGAPRAWASGTGAGVTIGVVDTGVDLRHPDLQGKVVATANCVGVPCHDGGGQDDNGHGTIVSGIVAAVTGNGRGVAGVAPDARLLVAKVLDSDGAGDVDDINAGIRWVVDHGAKVVNLSLGDPDFRLTSEIGTPLRPGIEYAWTRGVVPVLAAGNYRLGILDQGSANYGDLDALVVGATDRTQAVPSYSSSIGNAKWGLVAPGGTAQGTADDNVISTDLGGGYVAAAGTSMAAPHVAGAVAVLLGMGLSPTAAVQRVLATVSSAVPCGPGCKGGLDMAAAAAGGGRSPVQPGRGGGPATTAAAPSGRTGDQPLVSTRASGPRHTAGPVPGSDRDPLPIVGAVVLVAVVSAGWGVLTWTRLRGGGGP